MRVRRGGGKTGAASAWCQHPDHGPVVTSGEAGLNNVHLVMVSVCNRTTPEVTQ